jgi:thioredoxin-like negative regulator of GroEL
MLDSVVQQAAPANEAVSQETAFVLDADEARLLAEIGMLAAGTGDLKHADAVFGALRRLRPGRAYPLVGLAVARLNAGRAAEAAQVLEEAAPSEPEERAVAQAWRGLALQLAGRGGESLRLLQETVHLPGEGARLARQLLGLDDI